MRHRLIIFLIVLFAVPKLCAVNLPLKVTSITPHVLLFRVYPPNENGWTPDYRMTIDLTIQNVSKSAIASAVLGVGVAEKHMQGAGINANKFFYVYEENAAQGIPTMWSSRAEYDAHMAHVVEPTTENIELKLQPGQTKTIFYPDIISLGSNPETGVLENAGRSIVISLMALTYADGMLVKFGRYDDKYIGVGTIPPPMTLPTPSSKTPEKISEVSPPREMWLDPAPTHIAPLAEQIVEQLGGVIVQQYVNEYWASDKDKIARAFSICRSQKQKCIARANPHPNIQGFVDDPSCIALYNRCEVEADTPPIPRPVNFNLVIDNNGTVCDVQLAEPGHMEDDLDRLAIQHLNMPLFFPAVKDGVPVAVWLNGPLPWQLLKISVRDW